MPAKKIFASADRDKAHARLATEIKTNPASRAECRENHDAATNGGQPFEVWDGPIEWVPTEAPPEPPKVERAAGLSDADADKIARRMIAILEGKAGT